MRGFRVGHPRGSGSVYEDVRHGGRQAVTSRSEQLASEDAEPLFENEQEVEVLNDFRDPYGANTMRQRRAASPRSSRGTTVR